MKILYIGEILTYRHHLMGNVPSHWFYGACEMERDGHDVVWAQETSGVLNDIKLILKHSPALVFIPNLNIHNHLLLLLIAHFIRIPVFAYLHHEPQTKKGLKSELYKFLLGGVRHLFFLSEKTMNETVNAGLVKRYRCSVPGWGPNMDFYGKVQVSDNGWFVSTGKENRDFDTLIEAFRRTGQPLHIITARSHNGQSNEDIINKCAGIKNIKVTMVDNTPSNYMMMLKEMAAARALVCPLLPNKLNYCVGLSTITDAEGLGKPLIITDNPYHGTRPDKDGFIRVNTVEDWIQAIEKLSSVESKQVVSQFSMANAYNNMKKVLFTTL